MKAIAYYLPQFHEIPENNEWWGKGYTEWESVRKAKPLYPSHYQPTEPMKDYYYDLSEKSAIEWQVSLAKEYGLYGFCFHHYWFGEKMLLEKPAEIFFAEKDLEFHFCFSWANESWKRTWSAVEGNGWNDVYDTDVNHDRTKSGMLMKQEYGDRENWDKHFMYLLSFFQDNRYIRIDDKPVFIIYHAKDIPCLHSMLRRWDFLAKQNGLKGIYIISTNNTDIQNKYINANVIYEPVYSFRRGQGRFNEILFIYADKRRKKGKKAPWLYSYDATWKNILNRNVNSNRRTYLGGFVAFDKTPREGKNALLYLGASPKKFKKNFKKLVDKSKQLGNEFVFVNAWNEWGEGCYLEPDKKHRTKYLEAIRDVINRQ